jgi:5'-nucleotidase / UDP-sugar diphosphatase
MRRTSSSILLLAVLIAAQGMLARAQPAADPERVLGEAIVFLDGERDTVRTSETNLGNLIADIVRHYGDTRLGGADIGLQNAGSIRSSIDAGPITAEQVMEVYTHRNWIVVLELTGAEVLEVLEHSVGQYPEPSGGFLQVSGIEFTFDPARPVGGRVVEVLFEGAPLDPDETYYVATTNFVARGGDGYDMLGRVELSRLQNLYVADLTERIMNTQAIMDYIEAQGAVAPEVEGRITVLGQ